MAPLAVLLATSPLMAQDAGFSALGGFMYGFNSLEKVTGKISGMGLGVSYEKKIYKTANMFRLNLALNSFSISKDSKALPEASGSLTNIQLSGDVFLKMPAENLKFFAGISANSYSATYEAEPNPNRPIASTAPIEYEPNNPTDGIKMGIRAGLNYRVDKSFSFDLTLNLTEMGTSYTNNGGGLNPAWVQISARYHF
jgi:hypothetical protein